jgi:hypothetical protein
MLVATVALWLGVYSTVVSTAVATVALWLGVYSTVVSTAVALLTLYAEVFLRIKVVPRSGFYGSNQGPSFAEGPDAFPATGQTSNVRPDLTTCHRTRPSASSLAGTGPRRMRSRVASS